MSSRAGEVMGADDGDNDGEAQSHRRQATASLASFEVEGPEPKPPLHPLLSCIYNIPCVGGFCAPTVNPDESWARHFSNEYTIPASGAYLKIAPVIEWSTFCRFCGGIGVEFSDVSRRRVLTVAFAVSLFSWLLTFYAAMALSTNMDTVQSMHWASGSLVNTRANRVVMSTYVGVNMRVDVLDCADFRGRMITPADCQNMALDAGFEAKGDSGHYARGVRWDDELACSRPLIPAASRLPGVNVTEMQLVGQGICTKCKASAQTSVSLIILGIITQVPQMTTDLQRLTRFGDVNCQATMGFITSVFGCFNTLWALRAFSDSCWRSLPSFIDEDMDWIHFSWAPSSPLVALSIATALKLFDAACHLLVRTPAERGTVPPPSIQEKDLEQWMAIATDGRMAEPHF